MPPTTDETGADGEPVKVTKASFARHLAELPFAVGHLAAHTSSGASCAASTVSNRPTVVMGERSGGSSSRR